jgi:hypothetical protein
MPNKLLKQDDNISLIGVYVEHKLLERRVDEHDQKFANLEDKLDEILLISKDNQEKLNNIDNVKNAFKASWKYIIALIFIAFMLGLAIDNEAVVTKLYNYFTLQH